MPKSQSVPTSLLSLHHFIFCLSLSLFLRSSPTAMATRLMGDNAIEIFMRITGASRSVAVQKLEEYGGNLETAVNAHYGQLEAHNTNPMQGYMEDRPRGGVLPLLSAARSFRPSLLLDPNYRRSVLDQIGASVFPAHRPPNSYNGQFNSGYSGWSPTDNYSGSSVSYGLGTHGNVGRDGDSELSGTDAEEEMVRRAIEASKREVQGNSPVIATSQRQDSEEDEELARAISLSMKTAEEEVLRNRSLKNQDQLEGHDPRESVEKMKRDKLKLKSGSSSLQKAAQDVQEQQLWGNISPKELDEAILMENAFFGEIPERTSIQNSPHRQSASDQSVGLNSERIPCPTSSSVVAQRLLREQQDNEYLASLLADRDKELNASTEAEPSCLKESESKNVMPKEEELDRYLAAKEASLPLEPGVDNENAVTLLVRMPDGNRRSRRFLKSDKLQFVFDFIDIGKTVKPGTYRVVRSYPRRAFSTSDGTLTLNEVGLNNRQEALFLELI